MVDGDHRPVHHHAHEADGAGLRRGDRGAVGRCPQVHARGARSSMACPAGQSPQHRAAWERAATPRRPPAVAAALSGARLPGAARPGRRRAPRPEPATRAAAGTPRAAMVLSCYPACARRDTRRRVPRPAMWKSAVPARAWPRNCPSGGAACSTLGGAVCCALNAVRPAVQCTSSAWSIRRRQHVSFRGAGEQRLTTRIQPSTVEAHGFVCGGLCLLRSGPLVLMRSAMDARSTARLGHANQPSTIGRVREPHGLSHE